MNAQVARWTGPVGIAMVVALLISAFATGAPQNPTNSAAQISNWVAAHKTGMQVAAYFAGLALFLGVWYLMGLFWLLRRGSEADWLLPAVAVLGGVSALLVSMVGGVAEAGIAFRAAALHDVALNRMAYDTVTVTGTIIFLPAAAMVAAASIHAQRTGVLPTWLIWLGWVNVVTGFIGAVSGLSDAKLWFVFAIVALVTLMVWFVATSILIWSRAGQPEIWARPAEVSAKA